MVNMSAAQIASSILEDITCGEHEHAAVLAGLLCKPPQACCDLQTWAGWHTLLAGVDADCLPPLHAALRKQFVAHVHNFFQENAGERGAFCHYLRCMAPDHGDASWRRCLLSVAAKLAHLSDTITIDSPDLGNALVRRVGDKWVPHMAQLLRHMVPREQALSAANAPAYFQALDVTPDCARDEALRVLATATYLDAAQVARVNALLHFAGLPLDVANADQLVLLGEQHPPVFDGMLLRHLNGQRCDYFDPASVAHNRFLVKRMSQVYDIHWNTDIVLRVIAEKNYPLDKSLALYAMYKRPLHQLGVSNAVTAEATLVGAYLAAARPWALLTLHVEPSSTLPAAFADGYLKGADLLGRTDMANRVLDTIFNQATHPIPQHRLLVLLMAFLPSGRLPDVPMASKLACLQRSQFLQQPARYLTKLRLPLLSWLGFTEDTLAHQVLHGCAHLGWPPETCGALLQWLEPRMRQLLLAKDKPSNELLLHMSDVRQHLFRASALLDEGKPEQALKDHVLRLTEAQQVDAVQALVAKHGTAAFEAMQPFMAPGWRLWVLLHQDWKEDQHTQSGLIHHVLASFPPDVQLEERHVLAAAKLAATGGVLTLSYVAAVAQERIRDARWAALQPKADGAH